MNDDHCFNCALGEMCSVKDEIWKRIPAVIDKDKEQKSQGVARIFTALAESCKFYMRKPE